MSFAEFQIRLFAWKRTQEREWDKVRFISWNSLVGFHQDPKKLPKTIQKFLPLGIDKKKIAGVSNEQKTAYLKAYQEYLKQLSNGKS